ncbi:hypothetical protein U1Q18_042349 [Sarracenia purpurea var. burkii]
MRKKFAVGDISVGGGGSAVGGELPQFHVDKKFADRRYKAPRVIVFTSTVVDCGAHMRVGLRRPRLSAGV